MSACCSETPFCKCNVPGSEIWMKEVKKATNENLPLEAEIVSRERHKERLEHLRERGFNPAVSKHRKYQSNRIPPKKKRKK